MENINVKLKNEELTAVQFVHDYLQLHFQDKGFSFYIWPTIVIGNKTYKFGDTEYRNKLCDTIGQKVRGISIIETISLTIDFGNIKIIENLNPNDSNIISDICIFQDKTDFWIW